MALYPQGLGYGQEQWAPGKYAMQAGKGIYGLLGKLFGFGKGGEEQIGEEIGTDDGYTDVEEGSYNRGSQPQTLGDVYGPINFQKLGANLGPIRHQALGTTLGPIRHQGGAAFDMFDPSNINQQGGASFDQFDPNNIVGQGGESFDQFTPGNITQQGIGSGWDAGNIQHGGGLLGLLPKAQEGGGYSLAEDLEPSGAFGNYRQPVYNNAFTQNKSMWGR